MEETAQIREWIAARCAQGHYRVSVSDAYASYKAWALDRDPRAWVESVKMFSMLLDEIGYVRTRTQQRRYIVGLRLLDDAELTII